MDKNDQFTTWYDHGDSSIHSMSRFDLAASAWEEAWKRATSQILKTFDEWNKDGYMVVKGSRGKVVFSRDQVTKKRVRTYNEEDYERPEDDPYHDCEVF